jgi:hypothetical protein
MKGKLVHKELPGHASETAERSRPAAESNNLAEMRAAVARHQSQWYTEVKRALGVSYVSDRLGRNPFFWIETKLSPSGELSFTVLKASDGRPLTETLHILSGDDFPKVSEFIAKSLKPIERKPEIIYDPVPMDIAAVISTAAALLSRVYPAERVGKALEDLAAGGEGAGTDDPAKGEPRPVAPAVVLEWPIAKWKDASEKILGKKWGIITFLKREWEPFIHNTGNVITRDILASHDPEAEQALTRHLETHEFPEGISIIYPERLMRIAAERPELLRAMLGVHGMQDMR